MNSLRQIAKRGRSEFAFLSSPGTRESLLSIMDYHQPRYNRGSHNRGRRGGHKNYTNEEDRRDGGGGRGGRGRGRGRPPGLRGKEIGLYYRNLGLQRRAQQVEEQGTNISLNNRTEAHIAAVLKDIQDDSAKEKDLQGQAKDKALQDQAAASLPSASYSSAQSSADHDDFDDVECLDIDMDIGENWDGEFLSEFYQHQKDSSEGDEAPNSMTTNLVGNVTLDKKLFMEQERKAQDDQKYIDMMEFRKKLPSYKMKDTILEAIEDNQVVVLSGETGCGKTTQVPQFILDHFIDMGKGSHCRIVCTQPRRISAISVSERVSEERAESAKSENGSVGYQIRLETRMPRSQGSILYCTTGIMLKWLQSDKYLLNTTHIILDEVHERDILCDFLMIILKDLLAVRRDLKLILMSATLNAHMFSEYFNSCPMLNIPGFTYPVQEFNLEHILEMTKYKPPDHEVYGERAASQKPDKKWLWEYQQWCKGLYGYSPGTVELLEKFGYNKINLDLCAHLTKYLVQTRPPGAILIFLPGWEDIKKLTILLEKKCMLQSDRFLIIPLHSMLSTVNQKLVFERPPPGVRKIIVSTSIAETSITIEDVVYVIDCGKTKMKNFDIKNNLATLAPDWNAKANSRQRRGRAGRVQAGECYHLYTSFHAERLEDFQLPEILRTRLEELCLQIKMLKLGNIVEFVNKAMEAPPMQTLQNSIAFLKKLNALDDAENLTPLGYHLAKMPVDPQMGKMLLFAAMFSCLDPIMTVAAALSYKSPFYVPMGKESEVDIRRMELSDQSKSDHIMLVNAYARWEEAVEYHNESDYCYENFLSVQTLRMLKRMRQQFTDMLYGMKFLNSRNPHDPSANYNSGHTNVIFAILAAGLYPNVATVVKPAERHKPAKLNTKTDFSVSIHPSSVNVAEEDLGSPYLIYHLKQKTSKVWLYDCTPVSAYPLLFFGGEIALEQKKHRFRLRIDDYLNIHCTKSSAELMLELRRELDALLQYKITHPGVVNWEDRTKEALLLNTILDLIATGR